MQGINSKIYNLIQFPTLTWDGFKLTHIYSYKKAMMITDVDIIWLEIYILSRNIICDYEFRLAGHNFYKPIREDKSSI